MKLTLREVEKFYNGLAALKDHILPIKLSYAISYNKEALETELTRLQKEQTALFESYSTKDEDGNPVKTVTGNRIKYDLEEGSKAIVEKELSELLEMEVELDIRKVTCNDVEKASENEKYTTLTVGQFGYLNFMLTE